MANETKNMRSITIRVDDELYNSYKHVLREEGKIPTYDLRNHMKDTISTFEQKKAQSD
ncbi:transcriptional regulator [Staphylococcus cohnii]|nr:transcriptional regulator [Staphylococcus cohnii]